MKACLFLANNEPLTVEEMTLDAPSNPGEVHVKWSATGVCHSDLSIWQGKLPLPPGCILGHEGAGVVVDPGQNSIGLEKGDHVIGSFVPACGACYYCTHGQPFVCEQALMIGMSIMPFTRSDGSKMFGAVGGLATFAEESLVHESALVKIPSDFPLEQACLIGCGVTTGVGAAINAAKVQPGQTVAVIGCGGVGQSVIQGCRIAGAENIIAIDLNEAKRAAATKFGATHTHDPSVGDATEFVKELTGGRGADVAFEVVGVTALQRQAYDMTRPGGSTCFVGVPDLMAEVSLPGALIALENKSIIGTIYGSADVRKDFVKFVNYAKNGDLDLADMVSQRITINEINDAFKAMEEGDVIRSVVIYD
jgi:S-(hydroxymethyl)glutathione dehydrogenase/alcohol dehydrogenase